MLAKHYKVDLAADERLFFFRNAFNYMEKANQAEKHPEDPVEEVSLSDTVVINNDSLFLFVYPLATLSLKLCFILLWPLIFIIIHGGINIVRK